MYLVRNDASKAIVPGFLLGFRSEAMMPEYARYMKTLPVFIAFNASACAISTYGIAFVDDRLVLMAYGLFMAAHSVNMVVQRRIRVSLHGFPEPVFKAPLAVRLNACIVAATLLMMGVGFTRMQGELDSVFLEAFGAMMMGAGGGWLLSLCRGHMR